MNKIILGLVGSVAAMFMSSPYADYAPGDVYLECGQYIIAIETSIQQRMSNLAASSKDHDMYGSEITWDIEALRPGQTAGYPDPVWEGKAYRDYFLLAEFTDRRTPGLDSKVDRISGKLFKWYDNEREVSAKCSEELAALPPPRSGEELMDRVNNFSKKCEDKAKFVGYKEVAKCEKVSYRDVKSTVDKHNQKLGAPKF